LVVAAASTIGILTSARLFTGDSAAYYRGGSTVVALLTAALILALERSPTGAGSRVFGWTPFRELGRISYGFYLWHWPIILWLAVPEGFGFWERRVVNLAQFGLTLAVSVTSFLLMENPIRQGSVRIGRLRSPATIVVGVSTLLVAGVLSYALLAPNSTNGTVSADVTVDAEASGAESGEDSGATDPASSTTEPIDRAANADLAAAALEDRSFEPCPDPPHPCVKMDGTTTSSPTVVLIGDSTAQSYDPAMKELAERYGFRYVQAALGGCPISHRLLATGTDGELHKQSNFTCWNELPGVYEEVLEEFRPSLVIATSWNEKNQHVEGDTLLTSGSAQHLDAVATGLRETVDYLTSHGAKFAFIDILPPAMSVECLETGAPLSTQCQRPVNPETGEAPYNQLFGEIAAEKPEVVEITLQDVLCPEGTCPLVVDNVVMRYDGNHFTATGSRKIAPLIYERLKTAGIDLAALTGGGSA
jgi:hypothetical protein